MILAAIIVAACQLASLTCALAGAYWYFERKQARIERAITEELAKLVKGEPTALASVLLAAGKIVGTEAGRSAKASLFANLSNAKRDANLDAADAAAAELGESNPNLGAILAGMGSRSRKGVLSNPLLQLAMQGLLGGGTKSNGGAPGTGGASEYTGRRHRE